MVEAAHTLIVQASSLLALAMAVIALYLILKSNPKISAGKVRKWTTSMIVQIAVLAAAMIFMVIYHVFDIAIAQDLWHIGIGVALVVGAVVTGIIVSISRELA